MMPNQIPCWCRVDMYHEGSKGTALRQFRLEEGILETTPEDDVR